MPINRWNHTLHLGDVWNDEDLSFEQRRDKIVARIRAARWFKADDRPMYLDDLVDEIADATDEDEFNAPWALFYDFADGERIWVDTFKRPVTA